MNAVAAQEQWRGWIIDRQFALLDWLGGSVNTAVFRTELPRSHPQSAAIKLVRAEGATLAQQLSCWKELEALSHPSLLRIFDSGHCQILGARWLYIVTEYGDENLEPVLQVRPLSFQEVSELVPPVVEGLRFLHGRGLVHGRIKPSNIFAVKDQVKLSSDGIQSEVEGRRSRSVGAYDAPEAESAVLASSADIWSLGMMLVAAFNQRPLTWSRSSQTGPQVPKFIPPPYSRIAAECLRINPAERCSLEHIGDLVSQPPPPPKLEEPPPAPPRRRSFFPLALAMVLVVLAIAVIGWYARRSQAPASREPAPPPAATGPLEQSEPAPPPAATGLEKSEPAPPSAATTGPLERTEPTPPPAATAPEQSAPVEPAAGSLASSTTPDAEPDQIVKRVLPNVPLSARMTIQPVEGKIRVKVLVSVDEAGKVASASLVSAGPSHYFARLALQASEKWKFRPVTIGGKPAASQWLLEYRFGRKETEVNPVESH